MKLDILISMFVDQRYFQRLHKIVGQLSRDCVQPSHQDETEGVEIQGAAAE